MKPQLIIRLEDGLITELISNSAIEIVIIDHDIEAFDIEDIIRVPYDGCSTSEACCQITYPELNLRKVDELYEIVNNHIKTKKR